GRLHARMSRRMGPGGRPRPALRTHRNATRLEPNRPAGLISPRGSEGLLGPSANLFVAPGRETGAPGGRTPGFDRSAAQERPLDRPLQGTPDPGRAAADADAPDVAASMVAEASFGPLDSKAVGAHGAEAAHEAQAAHHAEAAHGAEAAHQAEAAHGAEAAHVSEQPDD